MVRIFKYTIRLVILLLLLTIVWDIPAKIKPAYRFDDPQFVQPPDSVPDDDTTLIMRYPFQDNNDLLYSPADTHPMYLGTPSNLDNEIEYDPETNEYIFKNKMGDVDYRNPTSMTFDEYREWELQNSLNAYWREKIRTEGGRDRGDGIIPKIYIGSKVFETIFGSNTIDIRPQGSAELIFGILANKTDNPTLNVRQRRTVNFDFQEKIQLNVIAKIGDKIEFRANYNTEATFDFENKLQLKYEGKEDDIIKLIEAGNVSLPLNTTLINGSQSLFGIKTKLQFGKTTVTGLFSQQESQTSSVTVEGGAQTNDFSLTAVEYDENKHFFLAQYFRDNYERALKDLPIVTSDVNIQRVEVWVTNIGAAVTENRNIVAFQDIGENSKIHNKSKIHPIPGNFLPSNNSNDLLNQIDTTKIRDINTVTNYLKGIFGFVPGIDFEKVEVARKLDASEFTINPKLGFISLNTNLNSDQTLAVAFQYTVIGYDSVFQVGEFSDQGISAPNCLITKLLKSTSLNTRIPMWNLMMKNVYSLGAYQINRDKFMLNIFYSGDENGVPTGYFTEGPEGIKGMPLIQVMNFDNLNSFLNPPADGIFDFIDGAATNGGTIQSSNGKVYFTVLEPFGDYLRKKITEAGGDTSLANKYAYDSLYTLTKVGAEQYPDKNKYLIEGSYRSSSGNEISLNAFNVPKGSVKVTAGGRTLTENVDYTVDYTLGRVRIINEGILNSGTPINISLENNTLFSLQTKRLMGAHIAHEFNRDLHFGATVLNLTERPLTQKVSYGNDPISNTIWGFDFSYQTESRFLTKLVDKIPLIETKAPSTIAIDGEFAHFIPGHSKVIGSDGTTYVDDFEGAKSTIDLKNFGTWFLSSTPQGQLDLFPETEITLDILKQINYGKNRAKLAWYIIDPLFYDRNSNLVPSNVNKNELSRNSVRQVLETEVFPNKDVPTGTPTNIPVFNLAYYPDERGPYNYDVTPSFISAGINQDGSLKEPETRWAGVMRKIESTDFEATNVEYIEFWLMDPFSEDSTNGGNLYFNLGDISEDILRDSRKSFENGLPTTATVTNVDTTGWGRVPNVQSLVESFDNEPASRPFQDVGYDGLGDNDERSFFSVSNGGIHSYLDSIEALYGANSEAYIRAFGDPSSDNYHYFRGGDYDNDPLYSSVLERYKNYNGPDGNSPTDQQNPESYPTAGTTLPNVEDINNDNTLSEAERYFQYMIKLDPDNMKVGENYITDIQEAQNVQLPNGDFTSTKWYQFKIPISQPNKVIGDIQDFRSIRFLRMFMKDFERPVVLRFATLELVRGEWRKFRRDLFAKGDYIPTDLQAQTTFDITTVNIEENGQRSPVPYVIPPGIEREINLGTTNLIRLNEQSMVLKVCDLIDGDARAAYKTTDLDLRQYKKLKMFVHAEKSRADQELEYGDLTCFIRLGADFTENYYEYEIPLAFTPWGTSAGNPDGIWPYNNRIEIDLEELVDVKHRRNIASRESNSTVSSIIPYIEYMGTSKVTVLGVPSISDVRAIMIGVRNPKKASETESEGKCAEIWVNELRLTDFNKDGGWAATARVSADLADFGRIVVSGTHSTSGFGSLEQKINETQLEAITQLDVATDLELGKFFPEESGIRIPMHFDYSKTVSNPEYNPLDPDIKLKNDLDSYDSKAQQDSVRKLSQNFTERKSINFMNVRKDRVGASKKPRVYDIENFNVTYAYSVLYHRDVDLEYEVQKQHRGGLGYNFNNTPKNVKPFEKAGFTKSKALKIIKDFNFYYLPKAFSFRTEMLREYNEMKLRNKSENPIKIIPTFVKKWDWNRTYNIRFDLTRGLSLELNAQADAFINEPPGSIDRSSEYYNKAAADTINVRSQILSLGTMNRYTQNFNANYKVPIDKLPMLDWTGLTANYQASYTWTASPLSIQQRLGNQIENSNTIQLNGNLAFERLYNKSGYLKKLLRRGSRGGPRPGTPGGRRNMSVANQDQPQEEEADTTKPKTNYIKIIGEEMLRILLGVKKATITYSESNGTVLPGFIPEPDLLGNSMGNTWAPGLGFAFGSQKDIRYDAVDNGWITTDSLLNQAFMRKHSDVLTYKVTVEPFTDFRVELSGDRNYTQNNQEFFRANSEGTFQSYSPTEAGSFSISYITLGTAFEKEGENNSSTTFDDLKAYRQEIARKLGDNNPNSLGRSPVYDSITNGYYPYGYGPTNQDVLMYSFLAAYSGKGPGKIKTDMFMKFPLPNWRLTFTGLTKIGLIKRYFQKINITHAYRSTYSVNSFRTNINYVEINDHPGELYQNSNVYIPEYDLGQISIAEQFAPLFGLDMTWENNILSKFEFKKSRNLTMAFANNQVTEVQSNEIIIGVGYRLKDLSFSVRSIGGGGRKTRISSDLNIKLDFSIRNNKTILRRIDEAVNQISAGQRIISINASIDYALSQKLNARLFFDKIINSPYVSNQYRTSTTNAGLSLRFSLSQ